MTIKINEYVYIGLDGALRRAPVARVRVPVVAPLSERDT